MELFIRAHDLGVKGEEQAAERVRELELSGVQLVAYKLCPDIACEPGAITDERARKLGNCFREKHVSVPLIGAYFNPVHPERSKAEKGKAIFKDYLDRARELGCAYVGSETGSYNGDKWTYHPLNRTEGALRHVVETFTELADHAASRGVNIAIEGAAGHCCFSPEVLHEALLRIDRPNVSVIFDLYNYLDAGNYRERYEILERGLSLFSGRILLYHLKDFTVEEGSLRQVGVGHGIMDIPRVLRTICEHDPKAKIVLEGTVGEDIPFAVDTVKQVFSKMK